MLEQFDIRIEDGIESRSSWRVEFVRQKILL